MKKEEGCISTLETNYSIEFDEAMDISDLISQLSSLKSDHEDWFEEYPISDLIDLDSSSQQQIQSHLLINFLNLLLVI